MKRMNPNDLQLWPHADKGGIKIDHRPSGLSVEKRDASVSLERNTRRAVKSLAKRHEIKYRTKRNREVSVRDVGPASVIATADLMSSLRKVQKEQETRRNNKRGPVTWVKNLFRRTGER